MEWPNYSTSIINSYQLLSSFDRDFTPGCLGRVTIVARLPCQEGHSKLVGADRVTCKLFLRKYYAHEWHGLTNSQVTFLWWLGPKVNVILGHYCYW
jgi:hypothetical protein